MNVRKLHHTLGKVFAPFLIVASLTAIPLFWRNDEVYAESTKKLLVAIHTWEIGAKYIGTIMALALMLLSITGLMISKKRPLKHKKDDSEGTEEEVSVDKKEPSAD